MTSRRWPLAVLATAGVALAVGLFYPAYEQGVWWQRLGDAQTALEANTTALHAAGVTGQPIDRLLTQCQAAVSSYNTAAQHLTLAPLDTAQECQP